MTRRSGVGLDRLVAGARARASHAKRDILSWPPISRLLGRTAAWETQRDTARRLTEDDPSDAAAWHQLGDALLALRERADADAAFARAVALAAESATTWKRGTSGLRTADASARAAEPSFVADTLSRARPHWTDADVWGIHAGALTDRKSTRLNSSHT